MHIKLVSLSLTVSALMAVANALEGSVSSNSPDNVAKADLSSELHLSSSGSASADLGGLQEELSKPGGHVEYLNNGGVLHDVFDIARGDKATASFSGSGGLSGDIKPSAEVVKQTNDRLRQGPQLDRNKRALSVYKRAASAIRRRYAIAGRGEEANEEDEEENENEDEQNATEGNTDEDSESENSEW